MVVYETPNKILYQMSIVICFLQNIVVNISRVHARIIARVRLSFTNYNMQKAKMVDSLKIKRPAYFLSN